MLLPTLNEIRTTNDVVAEFKGYNHNVYLENNQFYDMKNLSSGMYPALSPRTPRGTIQTMVKPNGLFDKNKLAWVDGTNFYYDGVIKGTVTDGKKQFASMGAYILIFPDKISYNTKDGTFAPLEKAFAATGTVSITGCTIDGTAANIASSTYVKIAATGINTGFKKFDGVTIAGCVVAELNKTTVIQEIGTDFLVIVGVLTATASQSGALTVNRKVPDMDFFTESENRLWGCSSANHEIYSSKLGDPLNWNCYEGISTDSYAVTVGTDGDFTGAFTYLGYAMFFKEDCIHKVYGSKPANYQILNNPCRGVAKGSEKSITIVNETLYYMSRNGIVAYSGGSPETISVPLGDTKYTDAVSGCYGDKYYVSMKDSSGVWHMFTFNETIGLWHKEDNTHVLYFTNLDGVLYYIDAVTLQLKTITGSDTDLIPWYAEFGDLSGSNLMKKYVSKLQFRLELDANSSFQIWIMYDNSDIWEPLTSLTGDRKRSYYVPIVTKRCDYYKIKLTGTGNFKLHSMVKVISEGSEL